MILQFQNQSAINEHLIKRTKKIDSILQKGSGSLNEDALFVSENRCGVFDGATSLVHKYYDDGQTGGKLAAEIAATSFRNCDDLISGAYQANLTIRNEAVFRGVDYSRKEELWSCSAAVVEFGVDSLSWCQIGDCRIILLYEDGSCRSLVNGTSQDAETLLAWKNKEMGSDNEDYSIMSVMADQILHDRRQMNIDFGVFNGEEEAIDFLQSGRESLEGVSSVILYTDGLIIPRENPYSAEDMGFLQSLYSNGGLKSLHEEVRSIQLSDISCRKYPRFKTHDDIAAVSIDL